MQLELIIAAGAMALVGATCVWVGGDHHADWDRCDLPSDCTLVASSCCGGCGAPALADVDGVNRALLDDHFRDVCPQPLPCPLCPSATNPELVATCSLGRCQALDVGGLALSACTADADCRLRTTGCCECGGSTAPWDLIAIAVGGEAAYQHLVCDPGAACAACQPVYPDTVLAYCAGDGHCAVREAARP